MIRLAVTIGLLALFALGYAGVEKVTLAGPRRQVEALAGLGARHAAAEAELAWSELRERLRGLVRAGGRDLAQQVERPVRESDASLLEPTMVALLDQAGGRGVISVLAVDGKRIVSVGTGSDVSPTGRAIRDARSGAAVVLLERSHDQLTLVAASPIGEGTPRGVLVLAVPIDRRVLRTWGTEDRVDLWVALVGAAGEVWLASSEAVVGQALTPSVKAIDLREDRFAVGLRPLTDDDGVAAQIAGLARFDTGSLAEIAGRTRLVYGVLAALAIMLVLTVLSVATGGAAKAEEEEEDDRASEWRDARSNPAEDLMAAARALDGERSPHPIQAEPLPMASFPISLTPAPEVRSAPPQPVPVFQPQPDPRPISAPPPTRAYDPPRPEFPTTRYDAPRDPFRAPEVMRPIPEPMRPPSDPLRAPIDPRGPLTPVSYASGTPAPSLGSGSIPPSASVFTRGRGMSPPPPAVAGGGPRVDGAQSIPGATPLPQLDPIPADNHGSTPSGRPVPGDLASYRPFDESHYKSVFDEFIGSKQRLGEATENISFEGFIAKLRRSEQALIDKHGCRTVRFQVVVRDRQVSLRPQLVR